MNEELNNSRPPRLPSPLIPPDPAPVESTSLFSGFGEDFVPMEKAPTLLNVVDNLLKHPARVSHAVTAGSSTWTRWILLGIVTLCMLVYGLIMGSFSGGQQWWVVPVKVVLGTILSAAICLPSLYIFASLSGSQRSFGEIVGLLLQSLALSGVLLVGFAPVAWIFSQSTNTAEFMGILHLLFWIAGLFFGLLLLRKAFGHLNRNRTAVLKFWNVVFVLVVLQMCTTLRPLVGKFEGYELKDKQFFVAHFLKLDSWNRSMDGHGRRY